LVRKFCAGEDHPSLLIAISECADPTQRSRFGELAREGGYDPKLLLGVWLTANHPRREPLRSELERRGLGELLALASLFRLDFNAACRAGRVHVKAFDGNNEIEVNGKQAGLLKLDLVKHKITLPNGTVLTTATAQQSEPPPVAQTARPRPRGPAPGTVDRYSKTDRALFPKIEELMNEKEISVTAAATMLAEQGKVSGVGTPKSKGKRLAERYRRERKN
jgi:hypothetical protein